MVTPRFTTKPKIHSPFSLRKIPPAHACPGSPFEQPSMFNLILPKGGETQLIICGTCCHKFLLVPSTFQAHVLISLIKDKPAELDGTPFILLNAQLQHHFQIYQHAWVKTTRNSMPCRFFCLLHRFKVNHSVRLAVKNCALAPRGQNLFRTDFPAQQPRRIWSSVSTAAPHKSHSALVTTQSPWNAVHSWRVDWE